jgi:hypothetical protein
VEGIHGDFQFPDEGEKLANVKNVESYTRSQWFGCGLVRRGSHAGSLVSNVVMLGGGGTFKRRGVVGSYHVMGASSSAGINVISLEWARSYGTG